MKRISMFSAAICGPFSAKFANNFAPTAHDFSTVASTASSAASAAAAAQSTADSAASTASAAQSAADTAQGHIDVGSGRKLQWDSTGDITGDGSEKEDGPITFPFTPSDGDRFVINGRIRASDVSTGGPNSGRNVMFIDLQDMEILRSSGAWVVRSEGVASQIVPSSAEGGIASGGPSAYFASTADEPAFGESSSGHNLAIFATPASGKVIRLEFDGTVAKVS